VLYLFVKTDLFGIRVPMLGESQLPASLVMLAMGLAITTVLALVSWHLYEKHFLKLKRFFPYARGSHERERLAEAEAQALALPEPAAADPIRRP